MTTSVRLSQLPLGDDGHPQRMEIQPFSKDIHDSPGVYLQKVEGCGYHVYELTADESIELGKKLIAAGKATKREFT